MASSQSLQLVLCRVRSVQISDNSRIELKIIKNNQIQYSSIAIFKNGCASFYRQSVIFSQKIEKMSIEIIEVNTKLTQAYLELDEKTMLKISHKNTSLQCQSNGYKVQCEARLLNDNDSRDHEITQRDLFEYNQQTKEQNQYFDSLQPAKIIKHNRRKKSLMVSKDKDSISQPSSSYQKSGDSTNNSFVRHKNMQQLSVHENNYIIVPKLSRCYVKSRQKTQEKKAKKILDVQRIQKVKEQRRTMLKTIKSESKLENLETSIKINQKNSYINKSKVFTQKLKKSKSAGFLDNINLKAWISTAFVGIITGITAAQI